MMIFCNILLIFSVLVILVIVVLVLVQDVLFLSLQDGNDGDIVVIGICKSFQDLIEIKCCVNLIVEVFSVEVVGKLFDNNIVELFVCFFGIIVDYQFGEGEQFLIVGVELVFNCLIIDGYFVVLVDWGGNLLDCLSCLFNYLLLLLIIISQVIVYKMFEVCLQEGVIGVIVDIVMCKLLDFKFNMIFVIGGYEYNDCVSCGSFCGFVFYSWYNDSDMFGFFGVFNYDKEQLSCVGIVNYYFVKGSIFFNVVGILLNNVMINGKVFDVVMFNVFKNVSYVVILVCEFFWQECQCMGFSGVIEFKLIDNLCLIVIVFVICGNYDNIFSFEYIYGFQGQYLIVVMLDIIVVNGVGVIILVMFVIILQKDVSGKIVVVVSGQFDMNYCCMCIKNDIYLVFFDWSLGEWLVIGNVGYMCVLGGKQFEYLFDFCMKQGFIVGVFGCDIIVNWVVFGMDVIKWVSNFINYGGESDIFNYWQIGGIFMQFGFMFDKEKFGEINFKCDLNWGLLMILLFGGCYVDYNNSNMIYGNVVYMNQNFMLVDFNLYVIFGDFYFGFGVSGNVLFYVMLDKDGIVNVLMKYGNFVVDWGFLKGEYWLVKECIVVGYVQVNFELGKFCGNIGGCYVNM